MSKILFRNEAKIISGTELAKDIQLEVKKDIEQWTAAGKKAPNLTVVLVGENPASATYVKNKAKACKNVGKCDADFALIAPVSSVVMTLLLVRQVRGLNPWLVKSDNVATAKRFFVAVLPRLLATEMGPATRYMRWRNYSRIKKT